MIAIPAGLTSNRYELEESSWERRLVYRGGSYIADGCVFFATRMDSGEYINKLLVGKRDSRTIAEIIGRSDDELLIYLACDFVGRPNFNNEIPTDSLIRLAEHYPDKSLPDDIERVTGAYAECDVRKQVAAEAELQVPTDRLIQLFESGAADRPNGWL